MIPDMRLDEIGLQQIVAIDPNNERRGRGRQSVEHCSHLAAVTFAPDEFHVQFGRVEHLLDFVGVPSDE